MKKLFLLSLIALVLASTSVWSKGGGDDDYDRLDGKGASGKRVDVIEWQDNLEIHVYPGGSIEGLALKIDRKNKANPVMVIGYRFKDYPKDQLIRRAVLGIPMNDSFKVYRDPSSGEEYDKIVITNHVLSSPMIAFKVDPPPTRLYPAEVTSEEEKMLAEKAKQGAQGSNNVDAKESSKSEAKRTPASDDSETAIKSFAW